MRFAEPEALLLLALIPLLLVARARWRRPGAIGVPGLRDIAGAPRTLAAVLYPLLPGLRALALAACVVALARPQWGLESTKVFSEGIAIAMVVDISTSMGALDLKIDDARVNRLEAVKRAFRAFVEGDGADLGGREGDLIGMLTFARYSDSLGPMTLDHEALLQVLDEVKIVTLPEEDGTAIGDAIVLAGEQLRKAAGASRVMILLTDGSNNAGDTSPIEAAQVAKAFGIKIYTIGAGSRGEALIPVRNGDGAIDYRPGQVFIDEYSLTQIADLTGGRYFRATDGAGLRAIYAEIDRLETSTNVGEQYQQYIEGFPVPLSIALALLLLEILLATTRLRTVP